MTRKPLKVVAFSLVIVAVVLVFGTKDGMALSDTVLATFPAGGSDGPLL